ncbi:MAG: DMT family transporter [Candidatus Poseidoniales archaeon]|jgi:drug/metabolite transporter (DMT)-like permease|tara:strand:- start:88 stop:1029 length:942 start_codon:yes stop_codon:yes gene_type:complete
MMNDSKLKTHLLMLLVAIIWGLSWAIGRMLTLELPPMTGAWLRYILTMIIFYLWFGIMAINGKKVRWFPNNKKTMKSLILIGFTGVLCYQFFFMHGMFYTAAGDASLIITFNPIFTVILAAPLLGQPISKKMFLGLFCGVLGVGIVTGWSPNTQIRFEDRIFGDLLILFASLSWATTTNMTKRLMEGKDGENNYSSLEIVVWYSLIGTIMITPFMIYDTWNYGIPKPSEEGWIAILYLGGLSTVIAYYWFTIGIEKLGATAASSYIFLVPVFGILGGWWLLDEQLGYTMIIGFVMILIGVKIVQNESKRLTTS